MPKAKWRVYLDLACCIHHRPSQQHPSGAGSIRSRRLARKQPSHTCHDNLDLQRARARSDMCAQFKNFVAGWSERTDKLFS